MNELLNKWSNEIGICFQLYSFYDDISSKYFIDKDKEEFGYIKKITDKDRYNNAYYIEDDNLNVVERLEYEKKFAKLSLGGTINKINISTLNKEEINDLVKYIYENIIYCNFKK